MNRERPPLHSNGDAEREQRHNARIITLIATSALSVTGALVASGEAVQRDIKIATYNLEANQIDTEPNNEMSEIASTLLGDDVRVNCDNDQLTMPGPSDLDHGRVAIGRVQNSSLTRLITQPVVTMNESICETVTAFDPATPPPLEGDQQYPVYLYDAWQYSKGIGVLLHELEHIKGIHNEAETNCYAFQRLPLALEQLGLEPNVAESGALVARLTEANTQINSYLSDECRPGGEYDLAISDSYLNYEPEEAN